MGRSIIPYVKIGRINKDKTLTQKMGDSGNKRIAKNTILLYIRMFLVMGVSLYTSRVILEALGVDNYGIYSVVAGVIGILSFINNSMSLSVQRFLTFHLGKKEWNVANVIFSMSINIHIAIGCIIAVILWFGGEYIIENYLVIPPERCSAAIVLFRFVIVSTVFNIIQVPFMGLIIAHERMDILALTSVVDVILKLLIAYLLIFLDTDSLQLYGFLLMVASGIIFGTYVIVSLRYIKNVTIRLIWDNDVFKRLIGFSSWSMLGEIAWALTIQGVSVIINLFYGVIGNASYGIASQVSVAVNRFVGSFQMAINPQIVKRYAMEEIESMLSLVYRGIRFSYLLLLMIAIPVIMGMDEILKLWLGTVPEYAVSMCKMIFVGVIVDTLSTLFATVVKAYGKIRNYQIIVSLILAMNFPLSYIALKMGGKPEAVIWVYCTVSVFLLIARVTIVQKMLHTDIVREYCKSVLYPIAVITIINLMIAQVIYGILPKNIWSILYYFLIIAFSMSISIYTIGLQKVERKLVQNTLARFISKCQKH